MILCFCFVYCRENQWTTIGFWIKYYSTSKGICIVNLKIWICIDYNTVVHCIRNISEISTTQYTAYSTVHCTVNMIIRDRDNDLSILNNIMYRYCINSIHHDSVTWSCMNTHTHTHTHTLGPCTVIYSKFLWYIILNHISLPILYSCIYILL